jgi:photosystem II stability/assembly factor-like uncharacterized protein
MSWTQTSATSNTWTAIASASSTNGQKLFACANNGIVSVSTNYGSTWTSQTIKYSGTSENAYFTCVASSADGTKLFATGSNANISPSITTCIYVSVNSGSTWTECIDASNNLPGTTLQAKNFFVGIACNSNGTKVVCAVQLGYIYTSTDSGTTWTQRTSTTQQWGPVTSDSTGTYLAAGIRFGPDNIYTSNDSGATWVRQTDASSPSRSWRSVVYSSDTSTLVACTLGSYIFKSTNKGVTWTQLTNAGTNTWGGLACSSNGSTIIAINSTSALLTSTDSGSTWSTQTITGPTTLSGVAADSTGTKLAVTNNSGSSSYIYANYTAPAVTIPIIVNGTNISSIFQAYTSGSQASATNIKFGGVDLNTYLAPYVSGTKAATTNLRVNGNDLCNIFAKAP